jgi:uncharacterized membrane protein
VRIKAQYLLYAINSLTAVLIAIIIFLPDNGLRIILGLPVLLFFPGYTLLAALFPRKGSLKDTERFALSIVLSIAIVLLIGLALNYTGWGIQLYPILISVFIFIFVVSVIAWCRARSLAAEDSYITTFDDKNPSIFSLWSRQTPRNKIITAALILLILLTLGTVGYVISIPKAQDSFTEFYVLNDQGNAEIYPSLVAPGHSFQVTLGIINRENKPTVYAIKINIDGKNAKEIGAISLNAEETWEQVVSISPTKTGLNQKVEFLLYKDGATVASETLVLWINVAETTGLTP